MATEKWVAGAVSSLTAGFGTEFTTTTLPSTDAVASSVVIDNTTAGDMFLSVSLLLGSAAFVAPNFFGVYIYPLSQDGTHYGDGRFATAAAGPPPAQYNVGSIGIVAATQAQYGSIPYMIPIPGLVKFKFVIYNGGGVTTATSGNQLYYQTWNRSIA